MSLEATSFGGTLRSTPKEGTLVFFQMPDELPVVESDANDVEDPVKNPAELVKDMENLPEGFIGKLQIMSSGRTKFILGDNYFDVEPGRPVGFRQVKYNNHTSHQ